MHILVHERASGNPCLLPVALTAVMPCAVHGGGAVKFGDRLILTVETRGELIEGFRTVSNIASCPHHAKADDEHAESINERAAAEEAQESPTLSQAKATLKRIGAAYVNAFNWNRRKGMQLPDAMPVMFSDAKGEHFTKGHYGDVELIELARRISETDGEELNRIHRCYEKYMEVMAGEIEA